MFLQVLYTSVLELHKQTSTSVLANLLVATRLEMHTAQKPQKFLYLNRDLNLIILHPAKKCFARLACLQSSSFVLL